MKKLLTGLLIGLIATSFLWVTENFQQVRLPEPGEPAGLYANQTRDNLRDVYVNAIEQARQSVLMIVYSLSDTQVIAALNRKSEQGLDVHVICDARASPYADRKLGTKVHLMRRFGDGLMHLKILVVDGKEVLLGSANMTGESLRMHGNLVMALESPDIAAMVKEKAKGMEAYGKSLPIPHQQFTVGSQEIELWFLPDNHGASLKIKDLIRSAQKTIRVAMFTFTREDFAKAMIDAAKRGVDVQVTVDRSSSQGASKKIVELLQKNGIPVTFNKGAGLLHHKFLYIDGTTLVNGSANWTKAAFTANDDCFMIMYHLTAKQSKRMDELWEAIAK